MNQLPPITWLNWLAAGFIALAIVAAVIITHKLRKATPHRNTPWLLRLAEATLIMIPGVMLNYRQAGLEPQAAAQFITYLFWERSPESAAVLFLGIPLICYALFLALKGRSSLAAGCLATLFFSILLACPQHGVPATILNAPTARYETLGLYSPIQGRPVPGVHLHIASKNLGAPPIAMTRDLALPLAPTSSRGGPPMLPAQAPATTGLQSLFQITFPTPAGLDFSLHYANVSWLYADTPAWLATPGKWDNFDTVIPSSIDYAETPRQYAPLIAWLTLHSDQIAQWWPIASANPDLLWEAIKPIDPGNIQLHALKNRLMLQVLNQGRPITAKNAPAVLDVITKRINERGTYSQRSIEAAGVSVCVPFIDPDALARWYLTRPSAKSTGTGDLGASRFPQSPLRTSYYAQTGLTDSVLIAWISHHKDEPKTLARLGNLIGKSLVLNNRHDIAYLLGGPLFEPIILSVNDHWRKYGWYPRSSIVRSDIGRTFDTAYYALSTKDIYAGNITSYDLGRALGTMRVRHQNPWSDLLFQIAFDQPRTPALEKALPSIWQARLNERQKDARYSPPDPWDQTLTSDWLFLSQVMGNIDPAQYIASAKAAIEAWPTVTPDPAHIAEVFDAGVDLPDKYRTPLWRELVKEIRKDPRAFGMPGPVDLSDTPAPRPPQELRQARAFLREISPQTPTHTLWLFYRQGMPPSVPALLATHPQPWARMQAVDLILRFPTPWNLVYLQKLMADPDPAVAAKARAGISIIARLQSLLLDQLPKPFTDNASNFFDLGESRK